MLQREHQHFLASDVSLESVACYTRACKLNTMGLICRYGRSCKRYLNWHCWAAQSCGAIAPRRIAFAASLVLPFSLECKNSTVSDNLVFDLLSEPVNNTCCVVKDGRGEESA